VFESSLITLSSRLLFEKNNVVQKHRPLMLQIKNRYECDDIQLSSESIVAYSEYPQLKCLVRKCYLYLNEFY
jgi:hypothetical protein